MRSRKLLALIFSLLAIAPALAGYMTLLGAGVGSIQPVVSWVSTTDPTFPSSSLTFSRASLATTFDSTGKLTTAPNNLLTYSNTFSNAAWTKSANASIVGGVSDPFGGTNAFTFTAAGAAANIFQNVTGNASTNYISSIWIRRRTGTGEVTYYKPNDSASTNIGPSLTGSWQQFSAISAGAPTTAWLDLVIATSGDAIDIYAATVSAVTYETTPRTGDQVITTSAAYYGPRIDYDPNTLAVKGLLIEEARTNVAIWGEDLSNAGWAWTTNGNSVTANATAGPAGTTTAALITPTAGSGLHRSERGISGFSLGATVSLSIFAKPNGYNNIQLGVYDTAYHGANFNVSTGAVANTDAGVTATIKPAANGFYRCTITYTTAGATTLYWEAYVRPNGTIDFNTWVADGTSGIYVDKAQMEVGSFATSYIPTAASSVTRAADVVQFTGTALTALQGSAGSAITETISLSDTSPASITNLIRGTNSILYRDTTGKTGTTNGTTALLTAAAPTWNVSLRNGLAWSAAGRSLVYTSGAVATDANAVSNGGTLYLGSNNGSAVENGWYKSFAIYNQRLSDATLQAKSVVGASYAANDNGVRFADNDNLPIHWRVAL